MSDGEDSDYEYMGGDMALYDSALDNTDELLYVKETFASNQRAIEGMNKLSGDEWTIFKATMEAAEALKGREEQLKRRIEEMDGRTRRKN